MRPGAADFAPSTHGILTFHAGAGCPTVGFRPNCTAIDGTLSPSSRFLGSFTEHFDGLATIRPGESQVPRGGFLHPSCRPERDSPTTQVNRTLHFGSAVIRSMPRDASTFVTLSFPHYGIPRTLWRVSARMVVAIGGRAAETGSVEPDVADWFDQIYTRLFWISHVSAKTPKVRPSATREEITCRRNSRLHRRNESVSPTGPRRAVLSKKKNSL